MTQPLVDRPRPTNQVYRWVEISRQNLNYDIKLDTSAGEENQAEDRDQDAQN